MALVSWYVVDIYTDAPYAAVATSKPSQCLSFSLQRQDLRASPGPASQPWASHVDLLSKSGFEATTFALIVEVSASASRAQSLILIIQCKVFLRLPYPCLPQLLLTVQR